MTVWNCFKYFFSSKIEFICFLTSSWLHSRWKYNWDFQTRYDHTLHGSLWHFDIFLIIDSVSSNVKDFYQNNSPIYLLKRTVNLTILIFNLQENCSCLDNAAILFINTNLLLEYRANWRFLFSTETHGRSLETQTHCLDTAQNFLASHSINYCQQTLNTPLNDKGNYDGLSNIFFLVQYNILWMIVFEVVQVVSLLMRW